MAKVQLNKIYKAYTGGNDNVSETELDPLVTTSDLENYVGGALEDVRAVTTLETSAELEDVITKLNEVINALK